MYLSDDGVEGLKSSEANYLIKSGSISRENQFAGVFSLMKQDPMNTLKKYSLHTVHFTPPLHVVVQGFQAYFQGKVVDVCLQKAGFVASIQT